jgi:hypothetical protein
MIALPAFLQNNGAIFGAGILLGALAAWGPASCVGKNQANALHAQKVIAASAKVETAATKAEKAAVLADMTRSARTQEEITELRKVVDDAKNDGAVGPATSDLLDRLRERDRRKGNSGAR